MKPTSIIFLIVSVILIIGGCITCSIGSTMAKTDGVELFDTTLDKEKNNIYTYEYTDDKISKMVLELGTADVTVIGTPDTNKIELINFPKGTYSFHVKNKILTLSDTLEATSLLDYFQNGFQFNGLRHYLRLHDFQNKPKSVRIYLTEESAMKIFNCTVKTGIVTLNDVKTRTDYTIFVEDGAILLNGLHTNSMLALETKQGNIEVQNILFRKGTVTIGTGDFVAENWTAGTVDIAIKTGDIDIGLKNKKSLVAYGFKTGMGEIMILDEKKGASYEEKIPIAFFELNGDVGVGNIKVR